MNDRSSDRLAEIERQIEHYRSILEKHKIQYEVLGRSIRKIEAELAEMEKDFAEQVAAYGHRPERVKSWRPMPEYPGT